MAKTSKAPKDRVGRQAPKGVWSPKELLDAIAKPSREQKLALLREVGILDENGKLAPKYKSWGSRVSRTE